MTIEKTPIEGLLVLQTENHEDNRGWFASKDWVKIFVGIMSEIKA